MTNIPNETGLSSAEAERLLHRFGKNELISKKKDGFLRKILHIVSEPMFVLLIAAAVIYFFLGEPRDGAIMLIFVVGIIGIEIIQEWKTDKTLSALKDLSAPRINVIRDGNEKVIASSDLVPGDIMLIQEGVKIPADGVVLKCSDLRVDESSLTGEAEGVWKTATAGTTSNDDYWRKDYCYAGTLVTQGTGVILVDKTGLCTEYGKIGLDVAEAPDNPTPLQKQTGKLVKTCAGIAGVLFALVGVVTWFNIPDHAPGDRVIESVLSGITLAMAMIPEEFPVILTVFLSMGAWRLAKKKSLVRKLPAVETLGAVSVLCVDKTGTITMNQMSVEEMWAPDGDTLRLCETMGLGCETEAYDPMEKAMLRHCEKAGITREHLFGSEFISEYPFTNTLKMMGHVWRHEGEIIIAVKGSPEKILTISDIPDEMKKAVEAKAESMSRQGLRVIAVGCQTLESKDDVPTGITECSLKLCGLVGLSDPPREGVAEDIAVCRKAGIRVVMITGDNGNTASAIAKRVGVAGYDKIITGDMLDRMTDDELRETIKTTSIFSRVIPEHKMRIVKAFKDNGEIVAMTGDGVNDAPALKYADIGIAMGKRGSEVSREAADLILMDDNFSTIVETVKDGRRIYNNIRKAVRYVFTIHTPIALASLLAPILGIDPANLFLLPLHVVLLELLIDPTCSIVFERQPAERNLMERPPRDPKEKMLTAKDLAISLIQGLVIFAASFGAYYYFVSKDPANAGLARTMGLLVIMLSNLLLVQVNSSSYDSIFRSMRRLSRDKVMWAVLLGTILLIVVTIYTPLNGLLKLVPLSGNQLIIAAFIAAVAVMWYELVKLVKRIKK